MVNGMLNIDFYIEGYGVDDLKLMIVVLICVLLLGCLGLASAVEEKVLLSANCNQGNGWKTDMAFQGPDYGTLRGYFQWDLSRIPSNAIIHSAKMYFFVGGAYYTDATVSIIAREITSAWTEGGDFQNPSVGSSDLGAPAAWTSTPGTSGYQMKELPKGLVQAWIEHTKANNGVLVSKTTSDGYMTIMNRASENPPYMMVNYSAPVADDSSISKKLSVLKGKNNTITFELQGNSIRLVGLMDNLSKRQFIKRYPGMPGLWRLEFRKPDGNDNDIEILDSDVSSVAPSVMAKSAAGMTIAWNGMALGDEPNAIDVIMLVRAIPGTRFTNWRIGVNNRSRKLGLWGVKFPRMYGITASKEAEATTPFAFGMVVKDPLNQEFGFSGRYPSALYSMQFCALSDKGVNLYMATHDPEAYVKEMRFEKLADGHGLVYEVNQLPDNMGVPGKNYSQTYECVTGTFPGDWVDAAKVYRKWVLGNSEWMKNKKPLYKRTDISEAMKRLPYWVGFHGMTEENMVTIEKLLKYIDVPAGVHLYHWMHYPHDTFYPEFWPPQDLTFGFVKRLHALNATVMPYTNQHLMDEQAASWKNDEAWKYVAMASGGAEKVEVWASGPGVKLRPMCPATTYWQTKFNELTVQMVRDLGVDAIYCDQVACVTPDLCFSPDHGHTIGGGSHWVSGYANQISNMRKAAASVKKGIFFTTESAAEPYDYDMNLRCNEGAPFLTPVWQMVYAGYKLSFGFYFYEEEEWIPKFATQYLWGIQIGWAGQHDPAKMPEICAFEREVARARYAASDYMALGEMLRFPKLTGDFSRIKFTWHNFGTKIPTDWPAVQGSLWKAPNGSVGLALVNMHTQPQTVTFNLNRGDLGFGKGAVKMSALYPKKLFADRTITTASLKQTVTLPARSAAMVVFIDHGIR